ncbi:AAA family ATPase [Nocardioides renjunii]|uniref:AAA family ATPase n=1 Tax=Nocardioides renjunii TaxID=3095075 RepID=UPI002AFF694B|nr:AAA family ATPase [Nocardioides sp. S-34]WQQ20891.1 AAA family ATPase [Nocardioides sp. S-34]
MTAIVESDRAHLALLQAMLHGSHAFSSMEELGDHIQATPAEFAVVIGPSITSEDASTLAQWARVNRPNLGVILLRHEVDSNALSLALRAGMREVVAAKDLAGITTAVQRARNVASAIVQTFEDEVQAAAQSALQSAQAAAAAATEAENNPRAKVLTVFATKGGVGKSLVATNTAAALADLGHNVCLVDLDVNNGDVAIMLQSTPHRTVADLVAFNGDIDKSAAETLLTPHSPGLSIVAAPVHLDSPDKATAEDVGKLLDTLQLMFDFVVVDTSGSFDDFALTALDHSATIVLVATLDIPSLKGLKLATGTLDLLNFPRETWKFVLNRADAKVGLSVDEFESTVGLKADHSLESAREVLACVNRGEAIVRAHPGHANSKAFKALAASLAAALSPKVPSQGTPEGRKSPGRLRLRKA